MDGSRKALRMPPPARPAPLAEPSPAGAMAGPTTHSAARTKRAGAPRSGTAGIISPRREAENRARTAASAAPASYRKGVT